MEVRPIRTEDDYKAACSEITVLLKAKPGTPDFDRLDVISTLVEAYERVHHRIPAPSPIDVIKFRMEQKGLKQKDLVPFIGQLSHVSEVLAGKRKLNLTMIQKLSAGLGIPLADLIKPIKLRSKIATRAKAPAAKKSAAKKGGRTTRRETERRV